MSTNVGFGSTYSAFSNLIDMYDEETECKEGIWKTTQGGASTFAEEEQDVNCSFTEGIDTVDILLSHFYYHKKLLTRVVSDHEVEEYIRCRRITYKLKSNGTFTPEFNICGNPPIIVHSEADLNGLRYGQKHDNIGCIIPDYENSKGGHYKCGKLACENPDICVYSMCSDASGGIMMFWEYDSQGASIPISRDTYEQNILRNVNSMKAKLAHKKH